MHGSINLMAIDTQNGLQVRRAERAHLLQKALTLLEQDQRVRAAWLFGSMGRGTHDDLSDIDLRIVVADRYIREVSASRDLWAASVGDPLLLLEAPQNAPPGGAYLLAMYPGQMGPQYLDLSWQPQSGMKIPREVHVLLNRMTSDEIVPSQEYKQASPKHETAETQLAFFWAMAPITAKYIARADSENARRMLEMLEGTLDKIAYLSGLEPRRGARHSVRGGPEEQLVALRDLSAEVERLSPGQANLLKSVSPEVVVQVYAFFDLVEAMIRPE